MSNYIAQDLIEEVVQNLDPYKVLEAHLDQIDGEPDFELVEERIAKIIQKKQRQFHDQKMVAQIKKMYPFLDLKEGEKVTIKLDILNRMSRTVEVKGPWIFGHHPIYIYLRINSLIENNRISLNYLECDLLPNNRLHFTYC